MKQSQVNYHNMGKAVYQVMGDFRPVWESKVHISAGCKRISDLITDIDQITKSQKTNNPKGHTAAIEQERTILEDQMYQIGSRLRAYAMTTNDVTLAAQVQFSRSSLDNLPLNKLLTLGRVIADACNTNMMALETYEVTQAEVETLQSAIRRTDHLNSHRDAVVDHRMENTSHLEELIERLRKELKIMDTLVDAYMIDEEFLTVYYNARRIHDIHGRKKQATNEPPNKK